MSLTKNRSWLRIHRHFFITYISPSITQTTATKQPINIIGWSEVLEWHLIIAIAIQIVWLQVLWPCSSTLTDVVVGVGWLNQLLILLQKSFSVQLAFSILKSCVDYLCQFWLQYCPHTVQYFALFICFWHYWGQHCNNQSNNLLSSTLWVYSVQTRLNQYQTNLVWWVCTNVGTPTIA